MKSLCCIVICERQSTKYLNRDKEKGNEHSSCDLVMRMIPYALLDDFFACLWPSLSGGR